MQTNPIIDATQPLASARVAPSTPASPPRSGPAAPLRRFKDVDSLETKSLAAVSSMELGSLVSIKAVVLCTLPIANIASASFSGPILKIVLGDIEDPSSQVLGVCFGPRAVLLPRLLKMNEAYCIGDAKVSFDKFEHAKVLNIGALTTFKPMEYKAPSVQLDSVFSDVQGSSMVFRINVTIAAFQGLPIYRSCVQCKRRWPEGELHCMFDGCQFHCIRYAVGVTMQDSAGMQERFTLFEELGQSLIEVSLHDGDDDTLLQAIDDRCKKLVNTKLSITLRTKKDAQGGGRLTLLATGPAISPTAPETKNLEAGVKHYVAIKSEEVLEIDAKADSAKVDSAASFISKRAKK